MEDDKKVIYDKLISTKLYQEYHQLFNLKLNITCQKVYQYFNNDSMTNKEYQNAILAIDNLYQSLSIQLQILCKNYHCDFYDWHNTAFGCDPL